MGEPTSPRDNNAASNVFKVAVVQMDSTANKDANLSAASSFIDEAAGADAQVICFPEGMGQIAASASPNDYETIPGLTSDFLANEAREHGVYIHGGSLLERIEGDVRAYNTSIIVSPDGKIIAEYRKMHLFDVALTDGTSVAESERVRAGDKIVVTNTPFGVWGCAICYDVRFPELFRAMALAGAQVIFVPSNFTKTTGRDHWEVLLRARAIENSCFVVAANQCGEKPEFTAYGHSMIIDPWGNILAEADGDAPEIIYADIDLTRVDAVRAQLPDVFNVVSP